jgi:hypothetical protein
MSSGFWGCFPLFFVFFLFWCPFCILHVCLGASDFFNVISLLPIYIYIKTPPRQGHFVYSPVFGKLWTRAKHSLHMDRVILRLCWRADPKKLIAPKEIRTLDQMEMPTRPRPLPVKSTPWAIFPQKYWSALLIYKQLM